MAAPCLIFAQLTSTLLSFTHTKFRPPHELPAGPVRTRAASRTAFLEAGAGVGRELGRFGRGGEFTCFLKCHKT